MKFKVDDEVAHKTTTTMQMMIVTAVFEATREYECEWEDSAGVHQKRKFSEGVLIPYNELINPKGGRF
jgi:uncharacterized protein YodC (DUF2158 family)